MFEWRYKYMFETSIFDIYVKFWEFIYAMFPCIYIPSKKKDGENCIDQQLQRAVWWNQKAYLLQIADLNTKTKNIYPLEV